MTSADGTRNRTQHSPELGEYVEYGERWDRSLVVIGIWVAIGLLATLLSQIQTSPDGTITCDTIRRATRCWPSAHDWAIYLWPAGFAFGVASIFLLRRLFRRPGVRVGALGLECRTGMLQSWFVTWTNVSHVAVSRRGLFRQNMRVIFRPHGAHNSPPVSRTVRLTGLSDPLDAIADDIDRRFDAGSRSTASARHKHYRRSHRLEGCTVTTQATNGQTDVTTEGLRTLLKKMRPGNSFLTLSRPVDGVDGAFIQAARRGDGSWRVEYRDGGSDSQYGADCADIDELFGLFVDWADGSDAWRTQLDWQPIQV